MSESSVLLERAFAEAKRLCYAGLDEKTLLQMVTERVRRVVPFEAYCVHANDPSSGLITYAIPGDAAMEEKTPIFLEHIYFKDEVTPFGWMVRRRLAAIPLSEATGGRLERALRYRELMVHMGFRHEVRGSSPWTASSGAASLRCGSPAVQTSKPARSPSSAGLPRTWRRA